MFNSPPIGFADTFQVRPGNVLEPGEAEGLLGNDFDIDGNMIEALLSYGTGTSHGTLSLHPDGSFRYAPADAFRGEDFFMYYLDDGRSYSSLIPVFLQVQHPTHVAPDALMTRATIYPNPGDGRFNVSISEPFQDARLTVVDLLGREILQMDLENPSTWVEIGNTKPGIYLFNLSIDQNQEQHRIFVY